MTRTTILLFIVSLFYVSVWADDCDPQPTPIPEGGFKLRVFIEVFDSSHPNQTQVIRDTGRSISAQFRSDRPGAKGNNRGPVFARTDQFGDIDIIDGRAPALWRFTELDGLCSNQFVDVAVSKNSQESIICALVRRLQGSFTSSPSAVEAESTPQPIAVYGEGISAEYGLPLIRYFDQNGVLVAETYADQVAPDGTWLTGSTTDLSSVYSGQYTVVICNATADGTWETLGAVTVEVFHYVEPPPDPDPCGGCGGGGNQCIEMPCYVY
jgi:hypothetical protein